MGYFADVLGARIAFAIEEMGVRVAMIELTNGPPHILLTDHLSGDRPIFIYRVVDLTSELAELKARGWKQERTFEIPMGPCCSFATQGGHRIAVYELSRPDGARHFEGRSDFNVCCQTCVRMTVKERRTTDVLRQFRPGYKAHGSADTMLWLDRRLRRRLES